MKFKILNTKYKILILIFLSLFCFAKNSNAIYSVADFKKFCKTKLLFGFLVVIIQLTFIQSAIGAPSISAVNGTINNGQNVTISGSGFGEKASTGPLIWDNFEFGTGKINDGNLATVGIWDGEGENYKPSYSNEVSYSGSQSAKCSNLASNGYNQRLVKRFTIGTIFLDFRMRVHYLDNKSRNWKTWILYSNSDGVGDAGDLQCDWFYFCDGTSGLTKYDGRGTLNNNSWSNIDYTNDKWMHYSLAFKESSPNVADGLIYHYIDEQVAGLASSSVLTRNVDHHYDYVTIGELWQYDSLGNCASNSGSYIYIDDIYIDNTWARVVIGDASTWTNCTNKEMQIPSVWSSNGQSITATLNQGSFANGSQAYLYVIDADGNVSDSSEYTPSHTQGYPITFGNSGGDTTSPSAPSGLSIL